MRRRAAHGWGRVAAAWLAAIGLGCSREPAPHGVDAWSSLFELALAQPPPGAFQTDLYANERRGPAGVAVIGIDRDHRTAIYQRAGSRVELAPVAPGNHCALEFAIGVEPRAARATDLAFRVSLGGAQPRALFEESWNAGADPAGGAGRWRERSVALAGAAQGEPVPLVFEVAGSAGAVAAWGSPALHCRRAAPEPRGGPPDVVLISIDTLRRDHLGLYGYARNTSPTLDALARESLVFDRAFATAPWTLPSHASMLTGLYPDQHGAGRGGPLKRMRGDVATLAEALAGAGYRTVAFTGGFAVGAPTGLARGFDTWRERPHASLRSVLPAVYATFDVEPDAPLFLLLHTYDVHAPYDQPSDYRLFAPDAASGGGHDAAWSRIRAERHHRILRLERYAGIDDLVAAYDDGIRFVDDALAALLDFLRARGRLDGTLLIVTSDHGEVLLDRDVYIGHSYTLYDEELRIPVIAHLPGGARAGRSDELFDLTDIAPLVLDVTGVETEAISGASPLARIDGRAPARALVRGEGTFLGDRFARDGDWKVMSAAHPHESVPASVLAELDLGERVFQLERDPGERVNLARSAALPDAVASLRRRVADDAPTAGASEDAGPALGERLRALGYLE